MASLIITTGSTDYYYLNDMAYHKSVYGSTMNITLKQCGLNIQMAIILELQFAAGTAKHATALTSADIMSFTY
jgi:hypothetical protein